NKIEIIPGKKISAQSVQSPHETECDFRSKNGKNTKGYNHNITETCDQEKDINLITCLQTTPATFPDNEFLKEAINKSQEILHDKIKNCHQDGAYNSEENQIYTDKENINFYLTGFQGAPGRYELTVLNGDVQVFDNLINKQIPVTITKKNKYRIKTENGYRYFTDKHVESNRLRKQVEQLPKEKRNIRNNVEATIFQLAYYLRKDKTKYRGFFKNKTWAILRSLWINFVRISNKITGNKENRRPNVKSALHLGLLNNLFLVFLNFNSIRIA
ncbi:MAG: hypothetical protein GY756_03895, partial [bacterium]|nr:hypothetical protein [bacterium]